MKFLKTLLPLMMVIVVCSAFSFKKNDKSVYIVGVSASFLDSVVYFTDIQTLDSVKLDSKKLLPSREQYSYQLKSYLENSLSLSNRTCFVYFSSNLSKLKKEISKVRDKYSKSQKVIVRDIKSDDFKFTKPVEE